MADRRDAPVLDDNPMYIRDYAKCILCWRCVQVCADDAQYTYAINFKGRGFDTAIGTFFDKPMPETTLRLLRSVRRRMPHRRAQTQARVRCSNRVFPWMKSCRQPEAGKRTPEEDRHDHRRSDRTAPPVPTAAWAAICELHIKDEYIYKVTSPFDCVVNHGNLCVKGRFGYDFILQQRPGHHAADSQASPGARRAHPGLRPQ